MTSISVCSDQCPHCKRQYSERFYDISTQLGPSLAKCSRCQTVFRSGKVEWKAMSMSQQVVFWSLTSFYTLVFGGSGGGLMFAVIQGIIYGKPNRWPALEGLTLGVFFICLALFPLVILGIQLYRIRQSQARTCRSRAPEIAVSTAFLSLEFGLQMKVLLFWFSLLGLAGLLMTYR